MFGRDPALWRSLQTVGGRSLRPLACQIWQSKYRSQTRTASARAVPAGQDGEESGGGRWEALLERTEVDGVPPRGGW